MAGVLRGDVFVSLDELMSRARRAATGLRALGVEPGGSVALLLRNDHEFFEAAFAASALGAATVPINWHGSAEEVAYVVNDSKAKVLVAHADLLPTCVTPSPRRSRSWASRRRRVSPNALRSTDDDATLPSDVTAWSTWRDGFEELTDTYIGDPLSMIYTSGTTGHPKGVRRLPGTNDGSLAIDYMSEVSKLFGAWPGMRTIIAGPMYHSAPLRLRPGRRARLRCVPGVGGPFRSRGVPLVDRTSPDHLDVHGADDVRATAATASRRFATATTSRRCVTCPIPPRRARRT